MKESVQNSLGASPFPSNVPMLALLVPFAPGPPLLPLLPPLILLYPFITPLIHNSPSKASVSFSTHICPDTLPFKYPNTSDSDPFRFRTSRLHSGLSHPSISHLAY